MRHDGPVLPPARLGELVLGAALDVAAVVHRVAAGEDRGGKEKPPPPDLEGWPRLPGGGASDSEGATAAENGKSGAAAARRRSDRIGGNGER